MNLNRQAICLANAKRLLVTTTVTFLIAGCGLPKVKVSEVPSSAIDISGMWVINRQLSESVQEVIRTALTPNSQSRGRTSSGGKGSGGGGRGSGGGGRGNGGGGRGGGSNSPVTTEPADEFLMENIFDLSPPADQIVIKQSTDGIAIQYGNYTARQHGYGQEAPVELFGSIGTQISGWQDHQFVVITDTEAGSRISERFTLSSDQTQLHIALKVEAKGLADPITVNRVFDRAADESALSGD